MAPVVVISQSEESMAAVAELLPRVVAPDDVRVVNAPVLAVVLPIVPGTAQVPPIKLEALIVPVEV